MFNDFKRQIEKSALARNTAIRVCVCVCESERETDRGKKRERGKAERKEITLNRRQLLILLYSHQRM